MVGRNEIVASEDLVDHREHQRQDQPAHRASDPRLQRVDRDDRVRHPARHVFGQMAVRVRPPPGDHLVGEIVFFAASSSSP